jgi:hypothetical protein
VLLFRNNYNSHHQCLVSSYSPLSPVVTICTASLTFSNSTFCPHSVFMCFVWIWEQTAIISLYSINRLVCITETECVYCAVRIGYLYNFQVSICLPKEQFYIFVSHLLMPTEATRLCLIFPAVPLSTCVNSQKYSPLSVTIKFWYNFVIISVVFNLCWLFSARMLDYQRYVTHTPYQKSISHQDQFFLKRFNSWPYQVMLFLLRPFNYCIPW